jgi:hypothetical protein
MKHMPEFTESVVKDATLGWLDSLGYAVLHGPDICGLAIPTLDREHTMKEINE